MPITKLGNELTERLGWGDSAKVLRRAQRAEDVGPGSLSYHPDLTRRMGKDITTKDYLKGAIPGAALGALLGVSPGPKRLPRAAYGGALGTVIGGAFLPGLKRMKENKKYLQEEGISPSSLTSRLSGYSFGPVEVTPEAKKKYLTEFEPKKVFSWR